MKWKKRFEAAHVEPLRKVIEQGKHPVLYMEYDYRNAGLRVVLPTGASSAVEDAVRAALDSKTPASSTPIPVEVCEPPEYRFTMHLDASLPQVKHSLINEVRIKEVTVSGLASLQTALDRLVILAQNFEYCVTFAMGGMPFLIRLCERTGPSLNPDHLESIEKLKSRFHLFPGLSWDGKWKDLSKKTFWEWLDLLPIGASILIFDTTGKGHATKRIERVLKEYGKTRGSNLVATKILVVGIVNAVKGSAASLKSHAFDIPAKLGNLKVQVEFVPVDELYTEDEAEVAGYESLRNQPAAPLWASAIVRILNAAGKCISVTSTDNLADLLDRLVFSPRLSTQKVFTKKNEKLTLQGLISSKHKRIKDREIDDIRRTVASGRLSENDSEIAIREVEARYERVSNAAVPTKNSKTAISVLSKSQKNWRRQI